jgi:hypothetical protein
MDRDPVRPGQLGKDGGGDGIRVTGLPDLPQSGDVVDIHR